MAGKTLIGGTAYEVTGGKTLINGTAYSIAGGKTLVNGTAYDISFGVDLAELFGGMTVLRTNGRNSGSTGRITIEVVSNYLNTGETGYIFSFFNGYMSIAKIVCGTAGTQAIYQSSESYGNCWYALSYDAIWYHDTMNNGYNSKYGATLALVKFDQPEAKVDAVLSKLQYVASNGRNYSYNDLLSIANSSIPDGNFIFVAHGSNFAINLKQGNETVINLGGNCSDRPTMLYLKSGGYYYVHTSNMGEGTYAYGATIHVVQGG